MASYITNKDLRRKGNSHALPPSGLKEQIGIGGFGRGRERSRKVWKLRRRLGGRTTGGQRARGGSAHIFLLPDLSVESQ